MKFNDNYLNLVAQIGTQRDKASHGVYTDASLSHQELSTAYINSWLAGVIVDVPARDAIREWRSWNTEQDQVEKIEELEKKLYLQSTVLDCLTAARLYGGAAIYINTDNNVDNSLPLDIHEDVKSLVVLTNEELREGDICKDIDNEFFGLPEFYTLLSEDGTIAEIHASRLMVMRGIRLPANRRDYKHGSWGASVLNRTLENVKQLDGTMANIASLVFEAKVDVLKLNGLFDILSQEGGTSLMHNRMMAQATMKGINGAIVMDAEDDYDQKHASFAGLPEIVNSFMENVAGAAGIPLTRLFGRSAAGLSGKGEGDEKVYFDRVSDIQELTIRPATALFDKLLVRQACGIEDESVFYEWRPLQQLNEKDRAQIFVDTANAARSLAGGMEEIIPIDALSDALVNELTEQGVLPGLLQSIEQYGSLGEQNSIINIKEDNDIIQGQSPDREQ